MLKTFEDYRKENYLVTSYNVALNKKWCMQNTCSTCGAMRLREFLFECATKNELKESDLDKDIIDDERVIIHRTESDSKNVGYHKHYACLLYTSPSPRDS